MDFWLHTVPFCSDKKAVFDVARPDKCNGDRDFLLRVFIDDLFPFVSALSKSIDRKLDDIVESFSNFFPNKTISVVIFDKIAFEHELIEFVQNGLWMRSSDFICDFSQSEAFLVDVLFEKGNESFLQFVEFECWHCVR